MSQPETAFFVTKWPTLQSLYSLNTELSLSFNVTNSNDIVAQQRNLGLLLLWTTANSGTPDTVNTYAIVGLDYACAVRSDRPGCVYKPGTEASTKFNLEAKPGSTLPPSNHGVILGSFFLCLATSFNPQVLVCESFSGFFELDATPGTSIRIRAEDDLQKPSTVLSISQSTDFLMTATTPGPTTVTLPPTGTKTVTPTRPILTTIALPSQSTNATSSQTAHTKGGGLPKAGIAGIVVVVVALLLALLGGFVFYRRRKGALKETPYPNAIELPRGGYHEKSELEVRNQGIMQPKAELDGKEIRRGDKISTAVEGAG